MKNNRLLLQRLLFTGYLFTFILILLITRIFFIQVIQGKKYANQVLPQQTLRIAIEDNRGNILDRNGIPLTRAQEKLELIIFPGIISENETVYALITALTGKSRDEFTGANKKAYHKEPIISQDSDLLYHIEQGLYNGIMIHRNSVRYDDTSIARHVVGHLRKSDGIPVSGIEKAFEQFLHPGTTTMVHALSDARRQMIPGLGYTIASVGEPFYDVQLTLDYYIQNILEDALDKYPDRYHGGVVVDVKTGDIVALASRPQYLQYNPSIQTNDIVQTSFLAIPFEQYPLGSVYKIVVAAAALESGLFDENSTFFCDGRIQVGNNFFSCHSSSGGLGEITLRQALAYSCNDTFIRIASQLGGDVIIEMSRKLGLGKALDLELDNAEGQLMDKASYTGPGIANLAIGQGETMVTPLQIADLILTLANNGQRKHLHLVQGLISSTGQLMENSKIMDKGQVLDPQIARALTDWMGDTTEYGTAQRARDHEIGGTAGKTGTPQVHGDPHSSEYGWFAGFFPQNKPKYVIVIMSREKGGAGSVAVPIFHEVARNIWLYESSLRMIP